MKTIDRAADFVKSLRKQGYSTNQIVAGLDNGDITAPEYISINAIGSNAIKIWDNEHFSHDWGFMKLTARVNKF